MQNKESTLCETPRVVAWFGFVRTVEVWCTDYLLPFLIEWQDWSMELYVITSLNILS